MDWWTHGILVRKPQDKNRPVHTRFYDIGSNEKLNEIYTTVTSKICELKWWDEKDLYEFIWNTSIENLETATSFVPKKYRNNASNTQFMPLWRSWGHDRGGSAFYNVFYDISTHEQVHEWTNGIAKIIDDEFWNHQELGFTQKWEASDEQVITMWNQKTSLHQATRVDGNWWDYWEEEWSMWAVRG
jgi:hypothetical protein